jgi:hypothetical protein
VRTAKPVLQRPRPAPVALPVTHRAYPNFPTNLDVLFANKKIRCSARAWIDEKGVAQRVAVVDCPRALHLLAASALTHWRWAKPSSPVPAGGLEVDIVHSRGDDLDQFQAGGRVHFLGSDEGFVGQDDVGLAEARAGLLPRARGMADEMAERFDAGEVDVTAVGRGAVEEDESVGHGSGGEMESALRREEGQVGECRGFRLPRFREWPSLRSWRRRLLRLRGRG